MTFDDCSRAPSVVIGPDESGESSLFNISKAGESHPNDAPQDNWKIYSNFIGNGEIFAKQMPEFGRNEKSFMRLVKLSSMDDDDWP